MSSPLHLPLLLLLLLLCARPSPALSAYTVTRLPGFPDPLPFNLETGSVTVDEAYGAELFYYFIQSEGNPAEDPLLLWLTGGNRCSVLSALAFEIGPVKFVISEYNGSLPALEYNPYSWTKWLIDHPKFLANPLYIGGDSKAGIYVPLLTQAISEGIEAGRQPLFNLKGYILGNPETGEKIDVNAQIPFAHGMGIISDEIFELTKRNCEGQDSRHPSTQLCATSLDAFNKPKCVIASPKPEINRRSMEEAHIKLLRPPPMPSLNCRTYAGYLCYYWANSNFTWEALHLKKGTVKEWQRCNEDLPFRREVKSAIKYHSNLTSRGYRALVYSGDHDMVVPFVGTKAWIKSLNFSIVDDWRSWHVVGQVAGYTMTYSNNLTFATVKGAGHTAPEFRPRECLAMLRRWISYNPL